MFNTLGLLMKFGPWLISGLFLLLSLCLQYDLGLVQGELDTAKANQATLQAGLNVAETFNKSLNASITELQLVVVNERLAFMDMQQYAADVDQRMNTAVSDIKGLLNEENKVDDCGAKPLPQPVIDRMWEYYRPTSGDGHSD